jgi:hypothetical protein
VDCFGGGREGLGVNAASCGCGIGGSVPPLCAARCLGCLLIGWISPLWIGLRDALESTFFLGEVWVFFASSVRSVISVLVIFYYLVLFPSMR